MHNGVIVLVVVVVVFVVFVVVVMVVDRVVVSLCDRLGTLVILWDDRLSTLVLLWGDRLGTLVLLWGNRLGRLPLLLGKVLIVVVGVVVLFHFQCGSRSCKESNAEEGSHSRGCRCIKKFF